MSLWNGTPGQLQLTSPYTQPFNFLLNKQSTFANQHQQFPSQIEDQQEQIQHIVLQNNEKLHTPFSFQRSNDGNSKMHFSPNMRLAKPSWTLDDLQSYNAQQKTQTRNQPNQTGDNQQQQTNNYENVLVEDGSIQQLWRNGNSTNNTNEQSENDLEALEEWLEELEERRNMQLEEIEDQRKEVFDDFQVYLILMLPYVIFDKPVAKNFVATKLVSAILGKLGVSLEDNLVYMLFVKCVDIVALTRGRLKLVNNYKGSWYIQIYDYIVNKLKMGDVVRLGTQLFMPQGQMPTYEKIGTNVITV